MARERRPIWALSDEGMARVHAPQTRKRIAPHAAARLWRTCCLLQKTEIVLSRSRTSEEYEERYHANLEAFGKMKHMVAAMLFLARADHGMLTLSRSTIDLAHEGGESRGILGVRGSG